MAITPTFQLFEDICQELSFGVEAVLPDDSFLTPDRIEELQNEYGEMNPARAVPRALQELQSHFAARGSTAPFTVDLTTRTYTPIDPAFIDFVAKCIEIRGSRTLTDSGEFEIEVTRRLSLRGLGSFHRVGWKRTDGRQALFNTHMKKLGFSRVAYGNEKDGGFDILWLPLIGAVPHRPVIAFQCKNGSYDFANAGASNEATRMSLATHVGLDSSVHTICVVFNDYLEKELSLNKKYPFVPLGLSDLAAPENPSVTVEIL